MNDILRSMFDCLSGGNPIYLPSKFWEALNDKNVQQLESGGIQNIKQTVAQNYFTWVIGHKDRQFRFLARHTHLLSWPAILKGFFSHEPSFPLNPMRQRELVIFTRMLWKFVEKIDTERLLTHIDEPLEGNPFKIYMDNRLISQDLANSVLEYYSIRKYFKETANEKVTICELGAGYGRNGFVFLKAFPKCKYIIIDIPPALYISQHYLSSVFRDKKIFSFRPFDRFSDVEKEYHDADIIFLLPHQAELLPAKSVDLFINISSLHEMKMDQIHAYFKLIDKLTNGFFYSKQYWASHNPADGITIKRKDYPVPTKWKKLYLRKSKVQTYFFEAMYAISQEGELCIVACPQCKQDARLYFRTKDFNRKITRDIFHYYRCPACSLIFLSPIPQNLGKYYPNNYYLIPSSIGDLAKTAEYERYKINIIRQFASGGRLLEIGPAYGSFLYLAKQSGFDAEAIEMDANCCTFISEIIGAKVIQSNDPAESLKEVENYNVIALWHVVEHLPDPWKTLGAIAHKLQPGGILVIAAPNPEAFQFRVLGRFWPHVDAPRHLELIPQSLLTRRMQSLGLRTVWSTTTDEGTLGWNIFGWVYFFSNFTNSRRVKTLLTVIGRLASIILKPIERLNGFGSAYTIIYQKERR